MKDIVRDGVPEIDTVRFPRDMSAGRAARKAFEAVTAYNGFFRGGGMPGGLGLADCLSSVIGSDRLHHRFPQPDMAGIEVIVGVPHHIEILLRQFDRQLVHVQFKIAIDLVNKAAR